MTEPENPSSRPLRIAVQGTGNWGRNLVRACRNLPGAELAWIVDPDPNALAAASALAPNAKSASHINETEFEFDAAVAATPALAHAAHVGVLLERGIHVLCEKPAALFLSDAEQLIRKANSRSLCLAAGHQMVFHPVFVKLCDMVTEGEIGTILGIDAVRTGPVDFTKEPGVLWSYGPHDVSMMGALLTLETLRPEAELTHNADGLTVRATLSGTHEAGATIRIHLDGTATRKERVFSVRGDRGSLIFDDTVPGGQLTLRRDGAADMPVAVQTAPDALTRECTHFVHCIRTGALPRTGGAHLLQVTRLLADCAAS